MALVVVVVATHRLGIRLRQSRTEFRFVSSDIDLTPLHIADILVFIPKLMFGLMWHCAIREFNTIYTLHEYTYVKIIYTYIHVHMCRQVCIKTHISVVAPYLAVRGVRIHSGVWLLLCHASSNS